MPYADPIKQKEAQAKWYAKKYKTDRKFRQAESDRKAAWLQTDEGRASNYEATIRHLKKKKVEPSENRKPKAASRAKPAQLAASKKR